jgi:hypothetical protein
MSKDNNSDFKKLAENPAIFETFIDEVKEGYSKKMNLVKAARIVTPEIYSQKDFAVQMLRALEANYSDQIVFLDILKAIVQNNGEKIKQIDTRLRKGEPITSYWDKVFKEESKQTDNVKNELL